MGRIRQYASATERKAAYRSRMKATTISVDREAFTRIDRALIALQDNIWRAHTRGNPLASELYGTKPVDTLEAAVAWILQQINETKRTSAEEK